MPANTFITLNPTSGTGDGSVTVAATGAHTGRVARSKVVTGLTQGGASDSCTVSQSPLAEFVEITNSSYSINANQTTFTVTGKSNSRKLAFELSGTPVSGHVFSIGTTLTVVTEDGSGSTLSLALDSSHSAVITGDPGASERYTFSMTVTVPANTTTSAYSMSLTAKCNDATKTDTCTLTQGASSSSISFDKSSITLPQDGQDTDTLTVTSNDSWTLTVTDPE